MVSGMNAFLKSISVTIRRDPTNYRPKINKYNCTKDREQKLSGTFFYVGDDDNMPTYNNAISDVDDKPLY